MVAIHLPTTQPAAQDANLSLCLSRADASRYPILYHRYRTVPVPVQRSCRWYRYRCRYRYQWSYRCRYQRYRLWWSVVEFLRSCLRYRLRVRWSGRRDGTSEENATQSSQSRESRARGARVRALCVARCFYHCYTVYVYDETSQTNIALTSRQTSPGSAPARNSSRNESRAFVQAPDTVARPRGSHLRSGSVCLEDL